MKLTIIILFLSLMQVSATVYSQSTKFTFTAENKRVVDVLRQIEDNSKFRFFYLREQVNVERKVTVKANDATVEQILDELFIGRDVHYEVMNDFLIVLQGKSSKLGEAEFSRLFGEQKPAVSGKVTDPGGRPLPGVTVIIKGTTRGTVTNQNGEYLLSNIPENATLQFSFVGMKTREVAVAGQTTINVILEAETIGLEEVVAIGYGSQSKKKLTTAISEVKMEGVKDFPITNSGHILQGRVSGVIINENNGAPGSSPRISIHGISSINAGIGPLVVVDGFPVGTGMPQSLSPNDIEKITVLKDAASTSIYGARGSNGVILIETLKPEKTQTEIEYNVYGGFQYVPENWRPQTLNALQVAQYNKERVEEINAFSGSSSTVPSIYLNALNNPDKYKDGGTDWLDLLLQEGPDSPVQNHNLTIRGGNDKLKGTVSAGYLKQGGVLPNSGFKRYSFRTNIQSNLADWLKANTNVSVARTERNTLPESGSRGILMKAITASPLQPAYDENGNLIPYIPADSPGYFSFANPIYEAKAVQRESVGKDMNATINLDAHLIKGLHYKPQFYAQQYTQEINNFTPTTIGRFAIGSASNLSPGAPPYVNSATNQNRNITNWGIDNLLTYDKKIDDHSFNVLVGYTAQKQTGELAQINAAGFPTDNNLNYLEASEISAAVSDLTNWSLNAFFGRLSYDYKAKYLLELNYRREGSSRFGENNKYGNFPSASVGWRISEEDFYPEGFLVNELKVRASYGETGNSAIGDFDRFGNIISIPNLNNLSNNFNYVLNDNIVIGKALTSLGNQNLKWETSKQFNLGLTLGFLNDKITFNAGYYRKITEDMLFNVTIPQASGFSSTRDNVGEMLNQGWDFEVTSTMGTKNFSWNSNLSVSLLKNEVTYIPDQISKIITYYNITKEEEPVGSLYGYIIEGIFNTQEQLDDPELYGWSGAKQLGAYIFKDVNKDGAINALDKDVIGNPHPRVVMGFNNVFTYKNVSLSILTTGAFGYQILPQKNEVLYNEKGRWNVSTEFLNRWKSPEDPGKGLIPAIHYPGQHKASNLWIEDGDHLWIKNVTLGYNLPSSFLNQTKFISGLRFYLSIQNALKITDYTGWNPQVSTFGGSNPHTFGVDEFSYPINRTISLGANVKF